ncbi:GAF and ANTAR domain-containing protein [Kribbella caucasensis]|uniref:GAF and ANTAR domain-containing protein n=1 Tax=Kribbella caucasensis TaxID=2512215 RepID=UPI001EDEABEC|nr:GAF and ANTAR domain-containing protein [Kribbella sp. VKM Ac-2527]
MEKDDDGSVAEMFAEFAMRLHSQPTVETTVESIVRFALQAVGCDHASLVLVRRGSHLEVAAVTDPLAEQAIRTQLDCGQGPCLAGIADRVSELVPDTLTEHRWPTWASAMVELGLRSVLSVRVHADDAATGALNLIAEKPYAFGRDEEATAHILAQHAAVAVATAQQTTTLSLAVDARNTIGQAQGILMERYNLTPDQAFDVLRRYSQQNNIKLNAVARHLITTRKLPDIPRTTDSPK